MSDQLDTPLAGVLSQRPDELLQEWIREQTSNSAVRTDLLSNAELKQQSREFLRRFSEAVASGDRDDVMSNPWAPVRELLSEVSRARALRGFSPTETATFIFSLKQPLFASLSDAVQDPALLVREVWDTNRLLDKLGLFTTEVFQRSREEIISRQQQELLELSTPVVKLWEGVVAVPLIGTLDSARTQVVMESLLQRIVETGARIAIIDITGVPTVDTLVAQHLIKTVAAARLMGADCIISGIRPQIAQTIVHLGVELQGATTKATLADAISLALRETGWVVSRARG